MAHLRPLEHAASDITKSFTGVISLTPSSALVFFVVKYFPANRLPLDIWDEPEEEGGTLNPAVPFWCRTGC